MHQSPSLLLRTLLRLTKDEIVPLLHESGKAGNLPFGAAILTKANLHPITIAANDSRTSPLLHGETNCIRQFFALAADARPDTSSCIFFATHEPCSLCLSGIAWTAFPQVYFLFTYEDTRDRLGIPGDIDILQEVFRVPAPCDTKESLQNRPLYNKENKYFSAKSLDQVIEEIEDEKEKDQARIEVERTKSLWDGLVSNGLGQGLRIVPPRMPR